MSNGVRHLAPLDVTSFWVAEREISLYSEPIQTQSQDGCQVTPDTPKFQIAESIRAHRAARMVAGGAAG